ncbi:MAG: hypothetical protein PVJ60_04385 [Phycisphaerales bacterium]|jgi:hypothetical protein
MLKLGKKKQNSNKERDVKRKLVKEEINPIYDKEIAVHVMPKRFRSFTDTVERAKTTGILVLVSGIIFLITASILAYYFVIRPGMNDPAKEAKEAATALNTQVDTTEQATAEIPTASEEAPVVETAPETEPPATAQMKPVTPATATAPVVTEPAEEPVASATTTQTATGTEAKIVELSGPIDSDDDGLSDKEEIILGTNSQEKDSDGDGYEDLAEIFNLYNPAGSGKLEENLAISTYKNETFSYQMFYPVRWPSSKFGGDDSLMFTLGDNQFIQIIVQPNESKLDLRQWYLEQLNLAEFPVSRQITKNSWEGVASEDGLTFYLMDKKKEYIITINYSVGTATVISYKNLFRLMIDSFEISN